jgi:succinate dehydrogenase / fumarate reductase, cytochrome b subunit
MEKHERWRRLHTLTGALALGLFLVEHLLTNAAALGGEGLYAKVVGTLARSPALPFVEIVILAPLAFHAGYGIQLLRRSSSDATIARYGDRRLWVAQRLSASIVLVFVLLHLFELRASRLLFGMAPEAFYTVLTGRLSWTWAGVPWIALLYVIGLAATAFHFANGLVAATAAWSIAPSEIGRRRVRIATSVVGAALFTVGAVTVVGLATGTRLLPGADADSGPCGSAAPPLPGASGRP